MVKGLLLVAGLGALIGLALLLVVSPDAAAPTAPPWPFHADGEIFSLPCSDTQSIYFGACDGNLYCLDEHTGDLRWKQAGFERIDSNPVIVDDVVVFAALGDRLLALDRSDGSVRWETEFDGCGYNDPKLIGGDLVISARNQALVLQPSDGQVVHRYLYQGDAWDLASNSESLAIVVNSSLERNNYTGSGAILCFSPQADQARWATPLGGACLGTICCDQTHSFAGARDGYFYALDMSDGSIAWAIDCAPLTNGGISPVWADGHVHDAGEQIVFSIKHQNIGDPAALVAADKATGNVLWSLEHPSNICGQFAVTQGMALAATQDRQILVVDLADGNLHKVHPMVGQSRGEFAGVVIHSGHLFVVGADGQVQRIPLQQLLPGNPGAGVGPGTLESVATETD